MTKEEAVSLDLNHPVKSAISVGQTPYADFNERGQFETADADRDKQFLLGKRPAD